MWVMGPWDVLFSLLFMFELFYIKNVPSPKAWDSQTGTDEISDLLKFVMEEILLLLLSHFSHVRLCATP